MKYEVSVPEIIGRDPTIQKFNLPIQLNSDDEMNEEFSSNEEQ